MKRLLLLFFFLAASLMGMQQAKASHGQGGEIYYEYLGNNQYRVFMKFFRYCGSFASAPTNPVIDVSTPGCTPNVTSVTLTKAGITTIDALPSNFVQEQNVTNKCPNFDTDCEVSSSNVRGSEIHLYAGTVTLPANCANITFEFCVCCRNGNISNISNSSSQDFCLSSTLNTQGSGAIGNTSPEFLVAPTTSIPVNQPYTLSLGVCEPDGDSLVFSLGQIVGNAGLLPYIGGNSITNPFPSSSGFNLNTVTGQLTFTPSTLGNFVFAVIVEEYRNGIKIGQVSRDIQVTVIPGNLPGQNFTNLLPFLSDLNGNFPGTVFQRDFPACENTTAIINTRDLNVGANINTVLSVFINEDCAFPSTDAPNINISSDAFPVITIDWSPNPSTVRSQPYLLTVLVQDDYVIKGQQTFTYALRVPSATFGSAGYDVVSCNGAPVQLAGSSEEPGTVFTYSQISGGFGIDSVLNINSPSPIVYGATNGTRFALEAVSPNGCISYDTVTIEQSNQITARILNNDNVVITNATVCAGESIQLRASGGSEYLWSGGPISDPNIADPMLNPTSPTNYQVIVSSGGCSDTAYVYVNIDQPINVNLPSSDTICRNATLQLNAQSASGVTYSWTSSPKDTTLTGANTATPTVSPTFSTEYTVVAQSIACSATQTVNVNVRSSVAPDIEFVYLNKQNNTPLTFCDDTTQVIRVRPTTGKIDGCSVNRGSGSFCPAGDTVAVVGDINSSNTVTGNLSPLGNNQQGKRYQILIRANELRNDSLGIGDITSLSFYIENMNGLNAIRDFSVKMACLDTTGSQVQNSLTTLLSTAPQEVFNSQTYTFVAGKNTIFFDNPYFWSGDKNILIDICYNNPTTTGGGVAALRSTTTSFTSVAYNTEINNPDICTRCDIAGQGVTSNRPVMELSGCKTGPVSYTFEYLPGAGQPDSIANFFRDTLGNLVTDISDPNNIGAMLGREKDSVVYFTPPANLFFQSSPDTTFELVYQFKVTDYAGCENVVVDTITILQNVRDFEAPDTIAACFGDSITFTSSSAAADIYFFANVNDIGDFYDQNPSTVFREEGGLFEATATNRNECIARDTIVALIGEELDTTAFFTNPAFQLVYDQNTGDSIVDEIAPMAIEFINISLNDDSLYTWIVTDMETGDVLSSTFSRGNFTFNFPVSGDYLVQLVSYDSLSLIPTLGLNCSDTASLVIRLQDFVIPNVFTPNDDGINDTFEITGLKTGGSNSLTIFNRWGKEVYSSDDYDNSFDASDLAGGVYYYNFSFGRDGHVYKGWVQILK